MHVGLGLSSVRVVHIRSLCDQCFHSRFGSSCFVFNLVNSSSRCKNVWRMHYLLVEGGGREVEAQSGGGLRDDFVDGGLGLAVLVGASGQRWSSELRTARKESKEFRGWLEAKGFSVDGGGCSWAKHCKTNSFQGLAVRDTGGGVK